MNNQSKFTKDIINNERGLNSESVSGDRQEMFG